MSCMYLVDGWKCPNVIFRFAWRTYSKGFKASFRWAQNLINVLGRGEMQDRGGGRVRKSCLPARDVTAPAHVITLSLPTCTTLTTCSLLILAELRKIRLLQICNLWLCSLLLTWCPHPIASAEISCLKFPVACCLSYWQMLNHQTAIIYKYPVAWVNCCIGSSWCDLLFLKYQYCKIYVYVIFTKSNYVWGAEELKAVAPCLTVMNGATPCLLHVGVMC